MNEWGGGTLWFGGVVRSQCNGNAQLIVRWLWFGEAQHLSALNTDLYGTHSNWNLTRTSPTCLEHCNLPGLVDWHQNIMHICDNTLLLVASHSAVEGPLCDSNTQKNRSNASTVEGRRTASRQTDRQTIRRKESHSARLLEVFFLLLNCWRSKLKYSPSSYVSLERSLQALAVYNH